MNFQFDSQVSITYPDESRPVYRPIFTFQGVAVTWDTAPTTSEDLKILIVIPEFGEHEFLLRDIDPSGDSLTSWFHTIAGGPVVVGAKENIKITYPNTDANTVTVKILGEYGNG